MFDQQSAEDSAAVDPLGDLSIAPSCAQTLSRLASDGLRIRANVSVALGGLPARRNLLIIGEPTARELEVLFDPELVEMCLRGVSPLWPIPEPETDTLRGVTMGGVF
jgi:hypothetical protein